MYGGVLQLKFDNNGFSDHRSWRKAKQELLWHILFYFGVLVLFWEEWQCSPSPCSGAVGLHQHRLQGASLGTSSVLFVLCLVLWMGFVYSVSLFQSLGGIGRFWTRCGTCFGDSFEGII